MPKTAHNAINWFELPARDIDRAQTFYEQLLGSPLRREAMGDKTLAVFAYDDRAVGGCLMAGTGVPEPSTTGALAYLNAGAPRLTPYWRASRAPAGASPRPRSSSPKAWVVSRTSPIPKATVSVCTRWPDAGAAAVSAAVSAA